MTTTIRRCKAGQGTNAGPWPRAKNVKCVKCGAKPMALYRLGKESQGFQACMKCHQHYAVRHVTYTEYKPVDVQFVKKTNAQRKAAETRRRNKWRKEAEAERLAHTISFACPHCETQLRGELREGWTRTCPVCRKAHVLHNGEVIKSKADDLDRRAAS